jgi:ABC-2 type transport system permease protein
MESILAPEMITLVASNGSTALLQDEIAEGTIDGYLKIPDESSAEPIEFVSKNMTDFRIRNSLQIATEKALLTQKLSNAGVQEIDADSLLLHRPFEMAHLDKDRTKEKSPDFTMILTTSLIFASLLYLTILFYGQAVGRSVLMEKTSKTVEILLSSVRPVDILFGKIFGNALASLLQYGIWISASVALLKLFGPRFGITPGIALTPETFAYLVVYFILAYFLYCSIYATLGSASRDEQQLGQLSWPVIVVLIVPIMLITSIITSPQAPVIFALSLFPLTAPIVMFVRILLGAASGTEIFASIFLMVLATVSCVVLSTKIFTSCILLNGKTINLESVFSMFHERSAGREIQKRN